jgi:hypothetical protein
MIPSEFDPDMFFQEIKPENVVHSMIAGYNRSERRKIIKSLNKTENIEKYANREATKRANDLLDMAKTEAEKNAWMYIYAAVGVTLFSKYHFDNKMIDVFFDRCMKTVGDMQAKGICGGEAASKYLAEKCGIELVNED